MTLPKEYMTEEMEEQPRIEYTKRPINEGTVYFRYCPDESWATDRYFNQDEFEFMLEDGVLAPGMIVETQGKEYMVLGKQGACQWTHVV